MECDIETNYLPLPFIKLIGILSPTLVEIEQLKSFDADTPRNALDVFKTEFCTRKFISTKILKVRRVGDVYCRFLRRLNIWPIIKGRYHHIIWGRLCRKNINTVGRIRFIEFSQNPEIDGGLSWAYIRTFNFQQSASTLVHCIIVNQVRLAKMPQLQIEGMKNLFPLI